MKTRICRLIDIDIDDFEQSDFDTWLENDKDSMIFAVPDGYGVEDLELARAFCGRSQNLDNYNYN